MWQELMGAMDKPMGSFSWETLVPHLVNPAKVAIVEALSYMGQALSASELTKMFDDRDLNLSRVSYHVSSLAKAGGLVKIRERKVRGAVEKYFFFSPSTKT